MMNSIETGSAVKCGICGKDTTVSFVTDREGGKAYDLACFHRNGYCASCETLVRDVSDSIQQVRPHCTVCSGDPNDAD